ncbi:MAG: VanW family protein [Oscillospiraceae bacterium]|nr:VanW family protein [Oscillospiraceae bacterium]
MGKFEKQNRPGTVHSGQKGSPKKGAFASPRKKSNGRIILPVIIGVLVVAIGVCAGLICMRYSGKKSVEPQGEMIRENTYIAGVNVGGLEKQAALELLMQQYPSVNPPATTADGVQETVYSPLYGDQIMNIALYSAVAQVEMFKSDYTPFEDVDTQLTEEETTGETSENLEEDAALPVLTETEEVEAEEETVPPDPNAPLDANGVPCTLERTLCLPASEVNVLLDLTAAVDYAYSLGREVESAEPIVSIPLQQFISMDEAYIREFLNRAYEQTFAEGTQTLVEKGTTTISDENGGEIEVDCITITFGTVGRKLDVDALYAQVVEGYSNRRFELQAVYTESVPQTLDLDRLYQENGCYEPVNAELDLETYEVSSEENGYGFLMSEAITMAEAAKPGESIVLTLTELLPEVTQADLQKNLFADVLGSCKSPHVYNPVRTKNLDLASRSINGLVLLPGEVFSFNRVVGERTAAKGYGEAGVYVGGRTENQLGGGVCQVASAIYYACLQADLEIIERAPHRYVPSYVPWGMDATIYWGALDYKFRNNTAYPICIEVSVHDGAVYVDLIGTETRDYTVKMTYTVEKEIKGGVKKIYIHPEMADYASYSKYKNGETIQVGYDGCVVKTYMHKYDKNGDLISTTWVANSTYQSRDKEVAYVLDPSKPMQEQIDAMENPNKPTEPDPTEPEPTEPKPTEPEPTEPDPTEPEPTEPEPTEPKPTEPEPTEPEPTEPEPTEPEPTETEPTTASDTTGETSDNGG